VQETFQRRFTQRPPGIKHNSYITICNSINIETPELKRLRYEITYKLLFGLVYVDADDLFTLVNSGYYTGGHQYKPLYNHSRVNSRNQFFSVRVVTPSNSLLAQPSNFSSYSNFRGFIMKFEFFIIFFTYI